MSKISIKDVDLYYDDFQALKKINMEMKSNEITAFIGPSGCGKSTMLKCLNRMNDLIDGCRIEGLITLDGKDIYDKNYDVNLLRKRVGMVFQKPNPFPMSIYDNIAYGPRLHGEKNKAKLDEIVEKSLKGAAIWDEVKDNLKKNALSISGGQQQRICIARALAVEPEVLLMDEPTSALDPISTNKIEDLCQDLKSKYTIIMVTHNMQQAARISDKTAFFLTGEVIEFNNTDVLFSKPEDKRTEDYITGRFGLKDALETQGLEIAQKVYDSQETIYEMSKEVEDTCLRLLTTQSPVAKDLRFISSALRILSCMSKIGNHAQEISELVMLIGKSQLPKDLSMIRSMGKSAQKMLVESINAFTDDDIELANSVIKKDDEVDELFAHFMEESIELIKSGCENPEQIIDLIQVAKYIERIGDNAERIATWVIFSVTGERYEENAQ